MAARSPSPAPTAIALGSNLGNPLAMVKGAVEVLRHEATTTLLAQSHWYQTLAVGPPQPDYINGCILIESMRSPQALLHLLRAIERQFGRERREPWGPRTLDLDLLFYGDQVIQTPLLTVPHPRLTERAFVLVPLAELIPDWVHPLSGLTIQQHRDQVDCSGVARLTPSPQ